MAKVNASVESQSSTEEQLRLRLVQLSVFDKHL
jgi:hypothetical protein